MMHGSFKKYMNPVFIETGSYVGDGIRNAMNAGFKRIFSIELSQHYFDVCYSTFKRERNVYLFKGDSTHVLPLLLRIINEPITFWLDAHLCGDVTACGVEAVPLMLELQAIKEHEIKTHTILIDDMRLLRNHDAEWNYLQYGIKELEEMIMSINPKYKIEYVQGLVAQDILVARV
jgi:hypothetical protein